MVDFEDGATTTSSTSVPVIDLSNSLLLFFFGLPVDRKIFSRFHRPSDSTESKPTEAELSVAHVGYSEYMCGTCHVKGSAFLFCKWLDMTEESWQILQGTCIFWSYKLEQGLNALRTSFSFPWLDSTVV
ncbi:hypothetical protein L6164_004174 [Bauhinia variegata]|uniref:Uncharacterized protein n=1 Tax=Bauhinia variegata TaxID=167791 RepID=A0ACB9Q496_BAUVA|nr:hypothetical protein L6164_004174 [Bauhinia variegata]